jgi:hypothetical protein
MTTTTRCNASPTTHLPLVVLALAVCLLTVWGAAARAEVPIRLSVKFILDATGSRPALGLINTNDEVTAQVDLGNQILAAMGSEFRLELVEIVDLAGVPDWYGAMPLQDIVDLRDEARDDPDAFAWRSESANVYVSGSSGSGAAILPTNDSWFVNNANDIILVGQGLRTTTFIHEVGHLMNNEHTFEGGCSPSAVDNVMSYDVTRDRFEECQMDKQSRQASYGAMFLGRRAYYVDGQNGSDNDYASFDDPMRTLDRVLDYDPSVFQGTTLVLLNDTQLSEPVTIPDLEIVSRRGPRTIHEDNKLWELPTDIDPDFSPAVRALLRETRAADRARNRRGGVVALERAAQRASGRGQHAIWLELAERLRHTGDCVAAGAYYGRIAEHTTQVHLRQHVLREAATCEPSRVPPGN